VKLVLAAGFAPALATLSTSCLCWLDYTSKKKWSLPPVLPRHDFSTKEIHRLLQGGVNGLSSRSSESEGWSQSPVLPWAQRAYETCLSAGSTAVIEIVNRKSSIANEWSPHPEWTSQVLQVRCPQ